MKKQKSNGNELVSVEPRGGRPRIYDAQKHIKLLFEVYTSGEAVMAFCDEANISVATFWVWINNYPEFKEAYEICLPKGARISEKMALSGAYPNIKAWEFTHRNRYGKLYRMFAKPEEKDGTIQEKMNCIWDSFKYGLLTPSEFNQGMSGLMAGLKIEELDIQREALKKEKEEEFDISKVNQELVKMFMAVKMGKKVRVEDE